MRGGYEHGPASETSERPRITRIPRGLASQAQLPTLAVMQTPKPRDPLHGVTLERLLSELVEEFGWEELGRRVPVRCFLFDPSIKSSLTFLRKTPWARAKVEEMFANWKRGQ